MPRRIARFGWIPDLPDHRDFMYAAPTTVLKSIPPSMDLEPQCPKEVYDQGQLGSCTANAIAAAIEFNQIKQGNKEFTPSRLFIYYNERSIEHRTAIDSGAAIRDGIKSVAKQGVCPESMWAYSDQHPDQEGQPCPTCKFAQKPTDDCYNAAKNDVVSSYQRVLQDLNSMKGCIASGYPFVFGITVYSSFPMDTKTGEVPMPSTQDAAEGGHAILAVGYDDSTRMFKFRNSWGPTWAKGGYGFVPYAYLENAKLASDFWTIRSVEEKA
jgi:C1A family cysteine protease